MIAIRIHAFGGSEVLQIEDVARPVAASDEILVQVYASGVKPADWAVWWKRVAHRAVRGRMPASFPKVSEQYTTPANRTKHPAAYSRQIDSQSQREATDY